MNSTRTATLTEVLIDADWMQHGLRVFLQKPLEHEAQHDERLMQDFDAEHHS